MKTKMTKKKTEKILETAFGSYDGDPNNYISALCGLIPAPLLKDWQDYWDKINDAGLYFISDAINDDDYVLEDYYIVISLTRLLTAHMFIEDTYK